MISNDTVFQVRLPSAPVAMRVHKQQGTMQCVLGVAIFMGVAIFIVFAGAFFIGFLHGLASFITLATIAVKVFERGSVNAWRKLGAQVLTIA